eukprot:TRINITY_DN4336_c0_g2_i1.p1 TRINITY_DN4336_c0_g2~~TRINITY_DN4336_c0_g2_i1.p1  ORF type:complete len:224 (-),score=41.86 TRINITY_DN4336_c0_g2_i1:100-771(-)
MLREGLLMLTLKKHENLVTVHRLCIDRECPAIIMEYAPKGTLRNHLNNLENDLSRENIMHFVEGIAKGLSMLHKQKIVHRDVAARNILLGDDFIPMVSDFGLSRETDLQSSYNSRGLHALPIKWMAPESIRSGEFTTQSDIWSFGITIWEIITRKEPHTEMENIDARFLIRDNHLVPNIPTTVGETFSDIMKKCWYVDPDLRPSARDISEAMEDYSEDISSSD